MFQTLLILSTIQNWWVFKKYRLMKHTKNIWKKKDLQINWKFCTCHCFSFNFNDKKSTPELVAFNIVSQFLLTTIEFHYYCMNLSPQNFLFIVHLSNRKKSSNYKSHKVYIMNISMKQHNFASSLATTKWKINIL